MLNQQKPFLWTPKTEHKTLDKTSTSARSVQSHITVEISYNQEVEVVVLFNRVLHLSYKTEHKTQDKSSTSACGVANLHSLQLHVERALL